MRRQTQTVIMIRNQSVESMFRGDDNMKARILGNLVPLKERDNVSHFGRLLIIIIVVFTLRRF